MVSSSVSALFRSHPSFHISHTNLGVCKRPTTVVVCSSSSPAPTSPRHVLLQTSPSLALGSNPASAGFLSGSTGIESVPGPELPQIYFLKRFNEENQKKYAENDARFRSTPMLKELLEKSKVNKEKNSTEIQDKYCIRGAEWGVGDCSAEGMTPDEKDKFIAMLKEKAGVKD